MYKIIVTIIFINLLSACSTTNDPRKGGLFSGIENIHSGGYDRRVDSLRQRANRARSENIRLSEQNKKLNQQLQKDRQALVRINSDISKISQQMVILKKKIVSKKANQNLNRLELLKIKRTINGINSKITDLKASNVRRLPNNVKRQKVSTVNPNTIKQLEKRKNELSAHYVSLLKLLNSQL